VVNGIGQSHEASPNQSETILKLGSNRGSLRDIAETIGKGLKVPLVSIPPEKAGEHFGMFFGHAATQDIPGSSEWTRKILGWEPTGPGLIEDLTNMKY
jgi:hypothetical protein